MNPYFAGFLSGVLAGDRQADRSIIRGYVLTESRNPLRSVYVPNESGAWTLELKCYV